MQGLKRWSCEQGTRRIKQPRVQASASIRELAARVDQVHKAVFAGEEFTPSLPDQLQIRLPILPAVCPEGAK